MRRTKHMKIRDMLRRYDTKAYAVCGCQIELVFKEQMTEFQTSFPRWVVKDRVLCNYHKAILVLAKRKSDKKKGGD